MKIVNKETTLSEPLLEDKVRMSLIDILEIFDDQEFSLEELNKKLKSSERINLADENDLRKIEKYTQDDLEKLIAKGLLIKDGTKYKINKDADYFENIFETTN